jgi:protein-S-isoprenylcysteine O-methyltransferase Ste14
MGVILNVCHLWIVGLWVVMLVYWAIAAMFVRRGTDGRGLRAGMMVRLGLFVAIFAAVMAARRSSDLRALQWSVLHSVPSAISGAAIATLGAIAAFAARATIGRNWGSPATRKTGTDLVTSGPYRLVRHPIYSGVLLMMVGTAIGLFPLWWLVALAAGVYFTLSARAEEKFMTSRFPADYPAYRARTKMFVPFIF